MSPKLTHVSSALCNYDNYLKKFNDEIGYENICNKKDCCIYYRIF